VDRPWLSHYDPGVPASIDYPQISLPELVSRTAGRYPDRVATVFRGRKLRYRDLDRAAAAFAAGLIDLGIQPGERVALMLPNVPQYVVAFFGALRAGAVVVPTNPLYTQPELEHQLADAGAAAVVTLDQLFGKVQAALPATRVRSVIVGGVGAALPLHLRPLYATKMARQGGRRVRPGGIVRRFEELLRTRARGLPAVDPNGLASLQYTGGTTGISKGAMLSHRNLLANAFQAFSWQGGSHEGEAGILCAAPFFHVYGMTIGMNLAIISGATMLLLPRWIPKEAATLIRRYRPQFFPGVPTMYLSLAMVPGFAPKDFSSLRACVCGAAPLPPEVQQRFEGISGARVAEGYGLTEASPVTHCNPVYGDRRPGTVGVPFPDTEAMITDPETWMPLPNGTIGEMTVRGPQIMRGYWNRPEETLAVLRDGWLHTGDLAVADDEGYFAIVDRKKDLIIAGGYNVYPREVEDVLYSHPKVEEAAVIGVASAYRGETVKAVIVLRAGTHATADEIIAYCREQLAAYKVPRIVEFRDDLPKTMIGKVLRRELREQVGTTDSASTA
jgi:long-chain acyl-CoA synthetase